MRLINLALLILMTTCCLANDDEDSNELSISSKPKNLDADLRRALLKALTELENEDNGGVGNSENGNRIIEKASASAVSIYTESETAPKPSSTTTTTTIPTPKETKKPIIVVQRSQGIQHAPITTVEKSVLDPFNDAEQILTSASSSFTVPSQVSPTKSDVETRSNSASTTNLIRNDEKFTTKLNKLTTTTTTAPLVSTEENEAKVEDVQFFSAPLVAAFTVHQDAQGIPKKVEPIYKTIVNKNENDLKVSNTLRKEESQQKKKQDITAQFDLQQKQKSLEDEIARLNLSLRQQQQLNQQQQQLNQQQHEYFFRLQQEQSRLRNNAQPFRPMTSPPFNQFTTQGPVLRQFTTTEKPVLNQFSTNPAVTSQQLPVKPAQIFSENSANVRNPVSLLPSITYDPILEAGKLPVNAQVLPVKGPINFHTPIIQTAGFQQFHSLPHNVPFVAFNQPPIQPQFNIIDNQRNRFFRQEAGVGNFVNNDVNNNFPSFSTHKSVQPTQQNVFPVPNQAVNFNAFALPVAQQNNRFFRSNPQNQNFQESQNNRLFRSNLESSQRAANNYQQSNLNNYQLRNLLYSSGALREKSPVDINIISKVLSFNHPGNSQFVSSRRRDEVIKEV